MSKARKHKDGVPVESLPKYESKPRVDQPNTPSGHSDKVRQTTQGAAMTNTKI
jgi:hypothetical protein